MKGREERRIGKLHTLHQVFHKFQTFQWAPARAILNQNPHELCGAHYIFGESNMSSGWGVLFIRIKYKYE
jgi:hypothetical protein